MAATRRIDGKLADITGPDITDRWGVTCTDLGASILAPNGTLVSVFGDTYSGKRVGHGDWRSPVILIGTGDASHAISYHRAGGADREYAQQLWRYPHHVVASGRPQRGISTVIPSDLLRVGDTLYLHAIVNRGFGNVVWTEIWRSDDSGISWRHLGRGTRFPAGSHNGHAQCWSWDYDPVDGWIYVVSTGFQRDKGIILKRVRPEHIGDRRKYSGWGHVAGHGVRSRRRSHPRVRRGESCRCDGCRPGNGSWADSSRPITRSATGSSTPSPHCVTRRYSTRLSVQPGTPKITRSAGSRNSTADTSCRARRWMLSAVSA